MVKLGKYSRKATAAVLAAVVATSMMVVPIMAAEDVDHSVAVAAKGENHSKSAEYGNVTVEANDSGSEYTVEHGSAVEADAYDGGEANIKTGDVKVTGDANYVTGVRVQSGEDGTASAEVGNVESIGAGVRAGGSGKSDVHVNGDVDAKYEAVSSGAYWGGESSVVVEGNVTAEEAMGVTSGAIGDGSKSDVYIKGDLHAGYYAGYADAGEGEAEATILIDGDVTSGNSGLRATATSGGTALVAVEGSIVSGGGDGGFRIHQGALNASAYSSGSKATAYVGGDVTQKDDDDVAVLINAIDSGKAEVMVEGTVKGGSTPIAIQGSTIVENVAITVWKVEPNKDGAIAGRMDAETGEIAQDEELEKSINYIIKLEDTSGATLYAKKTAQAGEKVVLKVDLEDGYELKGAYNGEGEKVAMLKDSNGDWYIEVPRGGGVYLSVELSKKEDNGGNGGDGGSGNTNVEGDGGKGGSDSSNTDNVKAWVDAQNAAIAAGVPAYVSSESFNVAGVNMVASAAQGAVVTINATSFTGISRDMVAALKVRPDVSLVITYTFRGVRFVVTIPAGTDLTTFLNADGGIDFVSLIAFTRIAL